ncbi:MAG: alpha-galactosidase, partial [Armatimonadetes bacterium]|nr:alpha-galactosidase [Candidatus Hippobium faecium]
MADSKRKNRFLNDILNKKLPFSFEYNGRVSNDFLDKWEYDCQKSGCDKGIKYDISYTDRESGLKYITELTEYEKDCALSWETYFENTGEVNSGQLSGIKVLDTVFSDMENPTLHSCFGSNCQADDFRPITEFLSETPFVLHTNLGRSTNYHAPYFNIRSQKSEQADTSGLVNAPIGKFVKEWTDGEGEGIVGALGWSGQWKGEFSADGSSAKCFMGLDDYVNFYLKPGEKVHVPSMYLVFSEGTFEDNQNAFRKFLTDYIIPRDKNGEIIKAPLMVSGWGAMRTGEYEKRLEKITEHKLPYEYYWMDAGWYGDEEYYEVSEATSRWALNVGNWKVNRFRHPKGLRYLSDKFAEAGLKYLLWIEIERA